MDKLPDKVYNFDAPPAEITPTEFEQDVSSLGFMEAIKERILQDFAAAKQFLDPFHKKCDEFFELYHNVTKYRDLRKENKFPIPLTQKHVDYFVADTQDKLWYAKEPCTIIGREDTDKADADAKQAMMSYQDDEDHMYSKLGIWIRDCALYRLCAAQVDYDERKIKQWVEAPVYQRQYDAVTGELLVDENDKPVYATDANGTPISTGQTEWVRQEVVIYKGARTSRVDPRNLFFTADKQAIDDEFPIMVRSYQSKNFFRDKPYFFNIDKIDIANESETDEEKKRRERLLDTDPDAKRTGRKYHYLEWQAQVRSADLYEWLASSDEHPEITELVPRKLYQEKYPDEDEGRLVEIDDHDMCWAIAGLANLDEVVRLDVHPFDGPNVRVGVMAAEEEGLIGLSLAGKIEAIHRGMEDLLGIAMENFKQTVDAQWIINKDYLHEQKAIVNKAGNIILITGQVNPDQAVKRVEQQRVSPDIHTFLSYFETWGKDADGIQSVIEGKGDRAAKTLGEANSVLMQASLRLRDYLRSIEDTFIKPLWALRNDVNSHYIDEEYAYRVVGESGKNWKRITVRQMRAAVDFICQSSTRETQRAVLIQQILQLAQIAPLALSAGQPCRMDKLQAELAEVGFNWSEDKINEIWPLIGMEKEQGVEVVNKMLAENAMLSQALMRLQMLSQISGAMQSGMMGQLGMGMPQGGQGGQPGPGQDLPSPTTESDALASVNAQQMPHGQGRIAEQ